MWVVCTWCGSTIVGTDGDGDRVEGVCRDCRDPLPASEPLELDGAWAEWVDIGGEG